MNIIFKYIATVCFIGYIPFAPGTFATLIAFFIYIIIKPTTQIILIILLFLIPLSIVSAHYTEKLFKVKDCKHIVIDEFCGYYFSIVFIPFTVINALIAFFVFRIFDILKPFPIRKIESILPGGLGIVGDDVLAGIYTNLIIRTIFLLN